MGKKKQFINKKTAQHFHVVHRSQRDPRANDPDASKYVLLSSKQQVEIEFRSDSENDDNDDSDDDDDDLPDLIASPTASGAAAATTTSFKPVTKRKAQSTATSAKAAFPVRKVRFGDIEAEDLVDEHGITRDGYDYAQHMKEMGSGKFYSADGQFASQSELARRVELPADVLPSGEEQDRLLDAITLTTDLMDDDLREALINNDAFEEMDDDFVVQAAVDAPLDASTATSGSVDAFDYDAHIAKLMAAASGVPKHRGDMSDDEDEDDDDEDDEDDSDSDESEEEEVDEASKAESQRVLDALFEKTLAEEYDDEQLGELDEEDPETRGDLVLEGELLDEIVEDYVTVRLEILNDEGKIGNPLRTGNRLQEILEECDKEREAAIEAGDVDADDDAAIETPEAAAARAADLAQALEDLYTRNAYLTSREEEQWDCETIVSTYSNLDNHPTLLREENPLAKKKKKHGSSAMANMDTAALLRMAAAGSAPAPVVLSKKTGMPLGVFESKRHAAETVAETAEEQEAAAAVAIVSKREKSESKDDKRARKEAVKQLKQQRRQEKKQWKTAFKDEEQRQLGLTPGGKVSIFKY